MSWIQRVFDLFRKARQLVLETREKMTADPENTIVDHYKGMKIRIHVRRFQDDAWRCTIRIYNAPHRVLQTVSATLRATDHGVSRQSAMAHAFLEALSLCDLILDKKKVQ